MKRILPTLEDDYAKLSRVQHVTKFVVIEETGVVDYVTSSLFCKFEDHLRNSEICFVAAVTSFQLYGLTSWAVRSVSTLNA